MSIVKVLGGDKVKKQILKYLKGYFCISEVRLYEILYNSRDISLQRFQCTSDLG